MHPRFLLSFWRLSVFGSFTYAIFGYLFPRIEQNLFKQRREMLERLIEPLWSSLESRHQEVLKGEITLEAAQRKTIERFRMIRYGKDGGDYCWVVDTTSVLLMHPYRSDLEGKNFGAIQGEGGKYPFAEMVKIAQSQEGGGVFWSTNGNGGIIPNRSSQRYRLCAYLNPGGGLSVRVPL